MCILSWVQATQATQQEWRYAAGTLTHMHRDACICSSLNSWTLLPSDVITRAIHTYYGIYTVDVPDPQHKLN